MKKNKWVFLIIIQFFTVSIIYFGNFLSLFNYFYSFENIKRNSSISAKGIPVLSWDDNGTAVCTVDNNQEYPEICSDGAGGAIITWVDSRGASQDIYAQRINSTGGKEWAVDGVAICTSVNDQFYPRICSDGAGGAIIAWHDKRSGTDDIYAQRINSSGGTEWTPNGVAICTATDYQLDHRICSDSEGGAIITWEDSRNFIGTEYDIYAQKINSSGVIKWTPNGVPISIASEDQVDPQICYDGAGGAIITWVDFRPPYPTNIAAQRINSSGSTQWTTNGIAICTILNPQRWPKICKSNNESVIITWMDRRFGATFEIFAQKLNINGTIEWVENGEIICNAINHQEFPQICSDGADGAIISWQDLRDGDYDVYIQKINSSGGVEWMNNGVPLCTESGDQMVTRICSNGEGGAIIAWRDERPGSNGTDIYAQLINSNGGVEMTLNGTPICKENFEQDILQICSNGKGGALITWQDYRNGTHYDIYVKKISMDKPPTSNHPNTISTPINGTETINWTLFDDFGEGKYRVWANDTNDNYYIWVDWNPWTNNSPLNIQINRTPSGIYNYIIEYNDSQSQNGNPDNVLVIMDEPPTSNQPTDIFTTISGTEVIYWILYDVWGEGQYQVLINGSIWIDWTPWINNTIITVPILRSFNGTYDYTIKFNDSENQFSIDSVIVIITTDAVIPDDPVIPTSPIYLIMPETNAIQDFYLMLIGLGIIGVITALSIITAIMVKNNRQIKEMSKKIEKTTVSKKVSKGKSN